MVNHNTQNELKMNRIMKTIVVIICALLLLGGCDKWPKDEELTLVKEPYNGNELRLDGYYYHSDTCDNHIFGSYFFYRNGVVLCGPGTPRDASDHFEFLEQGFAADYFTENNKRLKYRWGVFQIHDGSIVVEQWLIADGSKPVIRFSGNIVDDTTFVFTKSEYPHTGEEYQEDDVYHFHAFSPKPDSTNMFIP